MSPAATEQSQRQFNMVPQQFSVPQTKKNTTTTMEVENCGAGMWSVY